MATAWMRAAMPTQPLISSARRASGKAWTSRAASTPTAYARSTPQTHAPNSRHAAGKCPGAFPLPSSKLRPPAESIIPVHAMQTGKTASAQAHPQQTRSMPPARQAGKLRSSPIFRFSYRILSKTRHRQDGGKNGEPKPGGTGLHQHPRHGKPLKPPSPPITGAAASTRAIQTDRILAALPCAISRRSAAAPRAANISPQDRLPPKAETSSEAIHGQCPRISQRPKGRGHAPGGGTEQQPYRPRKRTEPCDARRPCGKEGKTGQTHQSKGIRSTPLPFPAAIVANPSATRACQNHSAGFIHRLLLPAAKENRTGRAQPYTSMP